jgi:YD repeat-containing protein
MARYEPDLQQLEQTARTAHYHQGEIQIWVDPFPLIGQIAFTRNGQSRMTTTRQYDNLNRLTSISSQGSAIGSSAIGYSYAYNDANQRTRASLADGAYWSYQYDPLGQVVSGKKHWADQGLVAGEQFEYTFDDIGNRTQTKAGGDEQGANLRVAAYQPNLLNQYDSRQVPGAVDGVRP